MTRSGGDLNSALLVTYKVRGTAVAGRDYLPLPGTKKIKVGKAQVRIHVTKLPGATGSLKVMLVGEDAYTVGLSNQGKLRLSSKP